MIKHLTLGCVLTTALTALPAVSAEVPKGMREQSLRMPAGTIERECPANLSGVKMEIESTFTPPKGWQGKPSPTIYSDLTVYRVHHAVGNNIMYCTYALSGAPGALRTTSIQQAAPTGKTCSAEDNFRFVCK